jgi:hypothetical protein
MALHNVKLFKKNVKLVIIVLEKLTNIYFLYVCKVKALYIYIYFINILYRQHHHHEMLFKVALNTITLTPNLLT